MNKVVLEAKNVSKHFTDGKTTVEVIRGLDLKVEEGQFVSIVGSSGSGKSTLLHVLGGLERPTEGMVFLNGQRFDNLGESERGFQRNLHLGFVYQFHHLLPEFSALQNVMIPLMIAKKAVKESEVAAAAILKRVGLGERLTHKPSELSGGERQRVAIARALVSKPSLILADEPTGNLDTDNAKSIFDLMIEINEEVGTALVMVTHDRELASKMGQQWQIKDKKLKQV